MLRNPRRGPEDARSDSFEQVLEETLDAKSRAAAGPALWMNG
jgi:hypothetical protein